MSLEAWVGIYAIQMAFWIWMVFFGGADRLEGSLILYVLSKRSSYLDAEGLRFVSWVFMIASSAWFVLGLLVPEIRFFW